MRYEPDRAGVAGILKTSEMGDAMRGAAARGAAHAVTISPEETGEYKASFRVDAEVQDGRQTGILANTADHATAVEWGARGGEGKHVLARTADWLEQG